MSFPVRSIKNTLKSNNKCMVLNMSNRSPDFKHTTDTIETNSLICDNIYNCEDVVEQARQTELINLQENIQNRRKIELFRKEVKQRVRNIEKMKRLKLEVQQRKIEAEQSMYSKKASDSANVMLGIVRAHPFTANHDNKKTSKGIKNKVNSDGFEVHQKKVLENSSIARRNLLNVNRPEDPPQPLDPPVQPEFDDPVASDNVSRNVVNDYIIDTKLDIDYKKKIFPELKQMDIKENSNESLNSHKKKKKKSKTATGSSLSHVTTNTRIVDVNPGAVDQATKRALQTQRALYRRHFMDIERNQIKLVSEKAEENKRIDLLKRDKELERKELEDLTIKFAKVKQFEKPILNNNEHDDAKLENNRKLKIEKLKMKKIENKRYVDALKQQLKDKVKNEGIDLPALCACWPDIWSMDTDKCANNCIFYKNPKEYEAVLKSMMVSCNINL